MNKDRKYYIIGVYLNQKNKIKYVGCLMAIKKEKKQKKTKIGKRLDWLLINVITHRNR